MLKKMIFCFVALCLGVSLAFFACFRGLVLPQYEKRVIKEAQLSANMIQEALNNIIGRPFESFCGEIIGNDYEAQDIYALSEQKTISIRETLDALQFINKKASSSNLFYSIDIYFAESNSVISSAFGLYHSENEKSNKYCPWVEPYISSDLHAGVIRTHEYFIPLIDSNLELFSFSQILLLPTENGVTKCVINCTVKRADLMKMLNIDSDYQDTSILAMDAENNMINLSSGSDSYADYTFSEVPSGSEIKLDGDSFLIYRSEKSNSFCQVIKLISMSEIYHSTQELNRIFLTSIFFILIASCLFGYFASVRIYTPIRQLLVQIQKKYEFSSNDLSNRTKNESRFISQVVQSLFNKVDTLESALQENQLILQSNLLFGLISGINYKKEEIERKMMLCGLSFEHPFFNVLRVDFHSDFFQQMDIKEFQLVKVDMMNRISQCSWEKCSFYPIETEELSFLAIINCTGEDVYDMLTTVLRDVLGYDSVKNTGCIVSVGGLCNSPDEIAWSSRLAASAGRYAFMYPTLGVYYYDVICHEKLKDRIPENLLAEFSSNLSNENMEDCLVALVNIIQEIKQEHYQEEYVFSLLSSLAGQTAGYLESYQKQKEFSGLQTDPWRKFTFISIDDFSNEITRLLNQIQLYKCNLKDNKKQVLIQSAISYIDEHIKSSITLNEVAEHIFISSAYLSKIFKQLTNINFNEYIYNRKMEYAKNALLSTRQSVESIALELGFTSSNYFIKRFKEFYGVTPNAYRTSHLNLREQK